MTQGFHGRYPESISTPQPATSGVTVSHSGIIVLETFAKAASASIFMLFNDARRCVEDLKSILRWLASLDWICLEEHSWWRSGHCLTCQIPESASPQPNSDGRK